MVYLASDHGGFELKEKIKEHLHQRGTPFRDLGTFSPLSVDYPDFAFAVADAVALDAAARGIIICTTGVGSCVAANKVKGIRAALGYSPLATQKARQDVDVNVLCLGGKTQQPKEAQEIVDIFLDTPFSGEERHRRRISKIQAREKIAWLFSPPRNTKGR